MVDRSDSDNIVVVVTGGVAGDGVVVLTVVAGCGDEDVPLGGGIGDGLAQRGIVGTAAPTVVGEFGSVGHRVVHRVDGPGEVAAAIGPEELEGHDLDTPIDAGNADAVVAHRADGARDVGAVAVVVHRVSIVVEEIVAADVIDVAVAVIILAVAGDLARVGPDVGLQVGVVVVDAGVYDGHHRLAGAGGFVPCLGSIDVGIEGAAGLTGVVHAPQFGEAGIVGYHLGGDFRIGLHQLHTGARLQGVERFDQPLIGQRGLVHPGHKRVSLAQLQARGVRAHGVIRLGPIGELDNQ